MQDTEETMVTDDIEETELDDGESPDLLSHNDNNSNKRTKTIETTARGKQVRDRAQPLMWVESCQLLNTLLGSVQKLSLFTPFTLIPNHTTLPHSGLKPQQSLRHSRPGCPGPPPSRQYLVPWQ
jgi:hypothetical protein